MKLGNMEKYDKTFYDANNAYARESSNVLVSLAQEITSATSVVDFGCAEGTWLADWKKHGVQDVLGLDGDYVETANLVIARDEFLAADLSQRIDLGRTFDLVQSLEVAEHLPPEKAPTFIENLTRHGPKVLFSAAPPGQGGLNHINEQPYGFWRDLFAANGYAVFDCVRSKISGNKAIAPWYRYNTFLYVRDDEVSNLHQNILGSRIAPNASISDISPWTYKGRKLIVRNLPFRVQQALVQLKRRQYASTA
jgi:SAM-dependent methyltransferase